MKERKHTYKRQKIIVPISGNKKFHCEEIEYKCTICGIIASEEEYKELL